MIYAISQIEGNPDLLYSQTEMDKQFIQLLVNKCLDLFYNIILYQVEGNQILDNWADDIQIGAINYMNTSGREPRWKQLGYARSNSQDISHVSKKSSRYTPKKSAASSEKQFNLSHLNGNSINFSDINAMKGGKELEKILPDHRNIVHYSQKFQGASQSGKNFQFKIQRYDSGGGSSLEGISSIYPKGPDAAKPIEARKITDKNRQNSGNSGSLGAASSTSYPFVCSPALTPEENFKQCLKYLEKVEKDLIDQKSQIGRNLNEKQQQFNKAKAKLYETFERRADEIQDESLLKVLLKNIDSKFKSPPKQLFRLTSAGDVSRKVYHKKPDVKGQVLAESNGPRRGMEESAYRDNMYRIVGAMQSMKKRLNECKDIVNEQVQYE